MSYFGKRTMDGRAFPSPPTRSRVIPVLTWMLIIAGIFLIQTNLTFLGAGLNLSVLVPFYVGVKKSPERGLLSGIGIGFLEDSLAGSIIGPNILSKGIVGLVSPLMSGKFFIWTPLFGIVSLFAMTFLDGLVSYAARDAFQSLPSSFGTVLLDNLIRSLINAPLGFVIRPRES